MKRLPRLSLGWLSMRAEQFNGVADPARIGSISFDVEAP